MVNLDPVCPLTFPGSPSSSSFLDACPDLGLGSVCPADFSSPPVWVKLSTRAEVRHATISMGG